MQGYVRTCNHKARQNKWVSARCEPRAWQGRKDARQAGRTFDAGKESTDEDGVEAEVYESSEHFRGGTQQMGKMMGVKVLLQPLSTVSPSRDDAVSYKLSSITSLTTSKALPSSS